MKASGEPEICRLNPSAQQKQIHAGAVKSLDKNKKEPAPPVAGAKPKSRRKKEKTETESEVKLAPVEELNVKATKKTAPKKSTAISSTQAKQYSASLKKMGYEDLIFQLSKKFAPPPSPEEMAAISVYTGGSFNNMNRLLRGQALDEEDLERFGNTEKTIKQHIELADRALKQLPPYEGTVYRSTTLPPEILASYKPGAVVTEHAFTSTSYDKNGAFNGNHKFVIASKTGRKVDNVSLFKKEKEVLFSPGTQYRVLKVQNKRGGKIIYMEEV